MRKPDNETKVFMTGRGLLINEEESESELQFKMVSDRMIQAKKVDEW
jgi:hypothetical protein